MATQEYYIREASENEARGPYNMEQLVSLAETGQVTIETLWYDAALEDWALIGNNDALKAAL
ncbi:MAG TPA: GYF domain-containing protein, partial [Opitutaceae bacterium]